MTVCRRGLHPLRGPEGVRDRSPGRSAGPEPSGRPRRCSLLLLFPVMVVGMARIGDRGRPGLFLSPGPGPPGATIPARAGLGEGSFKAWMAGKRDIRDRMGSGRCAARKMKEFFPQAGFCPFLSQISPSQQRYVLEKLLYQYLQVLPQTPPPSRGRRRRSHPQTG